MKIAPGVTLNLSKRGGSVSVGPRGAKFTAGRRGTRTSLGIPGTGMFYTHKLGANKKRSRSAATERFAPPPTRRLHLNFLQRLLTPKDEVTLVNGLREYVAGNEQAALTQFAKAAHLADGAFLAGFLALKLGRLDAAVRHLNAAADRHLQLGRYLNKYGIEAVMLFSITDEVAAVVGPDLRGTLLALVETFQERKQREHAIDVLQRLRRLEPNDVVVKLSLAELLLERRPDKTACNRVILLAGSIRNESEIHGALLLYKARALRHLGLNVAARDVLTRTLRRKKGRSQALLLALHYERGLVYETLGQSKRARGEFERIYSEDPDYEDVDERLGM